MYYGFDIGGSKIALGVFNQERRLQWEKRVATPKSSYEDFLQAVEALVREADERFDQQGSVGIGIPGMPETADGTLYAANVPAASGRPLRADLSARLGAMCVSIMTPTVSRCRKRGTMSLRNTRW
ncbi:N-acetyl-D-glucosamine kinase [Klebsiella aerogenes]|nr:N-acetyl-D-glucosamine kinase [Klebsiella aerogenes]